MTTESRDLETLEIVHALRVKGLASPEVLSALSGIEEAALDEAIQPLIDGGFVLKREGRFGGFQLTPAGKEEASKRLREDEVTTSAQADLETLYESFLPVNGEFKQVCSRWQLRDGEPNDHTDAEYDGQVVSELESLHVELVKALEVVAPALPRLGRYSGRLASALSRIQAGDQASFARPMYDSYHDIWMELHNDLLLSLDKQRGAADEGA
jgi:hypothetical protein